MLRQTLWQRRPRKRPAKPPVASLIPFCACDRARKSTFGEGWLGIPRATRVLTNKQTEISATLFLPSSTSARDADRSDHEPKLPPGAGLISSSFLWRHRGLPASPSLACMRLLRSSQRADAAAGGPAPGSPLLLPRPPTSPPLPSPPPFPSPCSPPYPFLPSPPLLCLHPPFPPLIVIPKHSTGPLAGPWARRKEKKEETLLQPSRENNPSTGSKGSPIWAARC